MLATLVSLAVSVPCEQFGPLAHFPDDPTAPTSVLPLAAVPRCAGGKVPPPPPHPDAVVLAGNAGFKVVGRKLDKELIDRVRVYPLVGVARLWCLTYRYDLLDANGNPRVVYIDRAALVLAPVKP
jgi:hypothetical protein